MAQRQFNLTIRDVGKGSVPPIIRLRHVLKSMLRTYGFRCVEAREIPVKSASQRPASVV